MFPVETLLHMSCIVDHRSPGMADDYGDHPLASTGSTTYRCWLAQSSRSERTENTTALEGERWALYLPPDAVIDANDAVTVDGQVYEVIGAPWPAVDPVTTFTSHIEATIGRRL